jgi:hypothetical protein
MANNVSIGSANNILERIAIIEKDPFVLASRALQATILKFKIAEQNEEDSEEKEKQALGKILPGSRFGVTPKDKYNNPFSSGAKTDDIKPPYHLIPPNTLKREAMAWKKGTDHYGENNWQKAKGDDKFIKERANHLIEHIFMWLSGDRQEDHLANVRCNAGILMELTEDENASKGK